MFTHLHTHSYYSFLEGIPSPQALVDAAVQEGMPALALTDRHVLTGAIEFYEACLNAQIKPILGLELVVEHPYGLGCLIFLAMDMIGWGSLCRLSSLSQTMPHRDPERGIAFAMMAKNSAGLICLSGGKGSLLNHLLAINQSDQAGDFLNQLNDPFIDSLYIELQQHNTQDQRMNRELAALASQRGLPCVATHNVHTLKAESAGLQRLVSAMRLNSTLKDIPADSPAPAGCDFKSGQQMEILFRDNPEAIAATQEIVDRCNLELPLGVPHYPEFPLSPGETPISILRQRAERGAQEIYGEISTSTRQRLDHELKTIAERGYAPLFLIMAEILDYARKEGVPTASRGSAASSLVAHCLGITTPDPLALNLYFERFLNPARSSPPDIDTDLCSRRRDKVIHHVYEQYGHDQVAMVATINRFRPRSALREVAKAHGLDEKIIKSLTAGLPRRGWRPAGRRGGEADPFADLAHQYSQYHQVFEDAAAIQGYPRHLSIHPGGVVIAPGPLSDLVPTHLASKGIVITQFDLNTVERMGLLKIDLLGTRGLSVLGDVAEQVRAWRASEFTSSLDVLDTIPEDDPETVEIIRSTRTIGCFGIESPGMRATLKEIDAQSPEDIMIALALYRPGPLTGGLKDVFVQRHLKLQDVEHIHPALSSSLKSTHGVILYQEQVLRIASELAGLSLSDADILRRAMSHFDPGQQMVTLKRRFLEGAQERHGVPQEIGERIWDMMAAFAGYGFPKAHAASYAQVAWRSAWCKAHYPAEFMAAVLANWGGYYRQRVYLNEARRMGIPLRPPHINHGRRQFSVTYPEGEANLVMGLDQVRDLTRRTQKRILAGRPFYNLSDFLTRVDPRPKEALNLIQIGALAGLGSIADMLTHIKSGGWQYRQPPLFEPLVDADDGGWDLTARTVAQERILGVGLDAHPLELVVDKVSRANALSTLQALDHNEETLRVAGVRQTLQRFHQEEQPFYILELEDLEGVLNVFVTPEQRQYYRRLLSGYAPLLVEGVMDLAHISGEPVLRMEKCWSLNS
jgi:DNA polymerase III subunit alpha